jgi:hypothetical protein
VVANVFERFRSLVLSAFLIVCLGLPAFAGAFEDAVAKFANDEFSDTEEAIGAVAVSGNSLAFPIISAFRLIPTPSRSLSRNRTAKLSTPRPGLRSTSCRTMLPPSASTTACAGALKPPSAG